MVEKTEDASKMEKFEGGACDYPDCINAYVGDAAPEVWVEVAMTGGDPYQNSAWKLCRDHAAEVQRWFGE